MSPPPPAICCLLILLILTAALFDLRSYRIPNWLTFAGLSLALALNAFLFPRTGIFYSLEGLAVASTIYFILYLLHAMGAGDVKLMAAIGAAVGPWNWFVILFLTAIFGALAALVLALAKHRLRKTFLNMGLLLRSLGKGRAPYRANPELDVQNDAALRLPHALAIALATLAFLALAATNPAAPPHR
jgi:prepilin peptidase CpaA